jgi:hypothetical protein
MIWGYASTKRMRTTDLDTLDELDTLDNLYNLDNLDNLDTLNTLDTLDDLDTLNSLNTQNNLYTLDTLDDLDNLDTLEFFTWMISESLGRLNCVGDVHPHQASRNFLQTYNFQFEINESSNSAKRHVIVYSKWN